MGLPDPHDPRRFTSFVKFAPDGSVAAIVEVADTMLQHHDPASDGNCYVEVTDLRKSVVNLYVLQIDSALVQKAMALPLTERPDLGDAFRHALAQAAPDALVDAVFGPADAAAQID